MAQLFVTLLFTALLVGAARLLLRELKRPLVQGPACWDDMLFDTLCDGRNGDNGLGQRRILAVRRAARRPLRVSQPAHFSAAA